MLQSGKLRHKIDIQVRSTVQDTHGEPEHVWTSFAQVRAAVVRTPGAEIFASAQAGGRVPVIFEIRYLKGVRPSMRVVFDGKFHDIKSAVDQQGRHEKLFLHTEEIVEATP